MKITISSKEPGQYKGDVLVYCVMQSVTKKPPVTGEKKIDTQIKYAFKTNDFLGKAGQSLMLYPASLDNFSLAKRVMVIGLGKDELSLDCLRKCGGDIAKATNKVKADTVIIVTPNIDLPACDVVKSMTEGIVLGRYNFNKYKTQQKAEEMPVSLNAISFIAKNNVKKLRKAAQMGLVAATAACKARDMANEPGNSWTATDFADYSLELSKKYNFKRKVMSEKNLIKMKMGGLLAVNQGTNEPPKMVILEYRTGKKVPTVLLVGKGLTFDSGGISLKPGAGMEDMKYDMCGGAAVLTAMQVVGEEKPKNIDVVAIVPATDNMPGPGALKPGDVVTHYNGKTSEIISTDAEGRLILADALAYGVKKYKPAAVIDLATLTGAVIVGLGHHRSGLMSNDDELANKIILAGETSGEPVWRLPLGKDYSKQIESNVADLRNVGKDGAGTITAGAFLQEFVGDTKWAHLDIAGTAWNFTEKSYVPKGPSGVGVRLLAELLRAW